MESRDDSWKREILSDFARWLDGLPDPSAARPGPVSQRGDMARLFAELAALRQEVKIQSRGQKKAVSTLYEATSTFATVGEELKTQRSAVEESLARHGAHLDARVVIEGFLEIGDSLVRSRDEAARLLEPRGELAGADAEGLVAGLDLIVGKFERILREFGVERIATVGESFDALTMTAVGTRAVADVHDGVVVEEVRGGYLRDGRVLRAASVFVNRAGSNAEAENEN